MFPGGMFPDDMFPSDFFPKFGADAGGLVEKFLKYTEPQDDAMLRKWGRTALPSMTATERRWCIGNEISGSSTDAEKKWARKIV